MLVTVEIPDTYASQMHLDGASAARRTLEALTIDGYNAGELSRGQVSEMLGLSFHETEALLKAHGCGLGLSIEDYERSLERGREFLRR